MATARPLILVVLIGLVTSGCDRDSSTPLPTESTTRQAAFAGDRQKIASSMHVWQLLSHSGQQCLEDIAALEKAVTQLADTPTEDRLLQARRAWHEAHHSLLQMSPLFNLAEARPGLFTPLQRSHFLLDAWPIEPGYLDSFGVYTHSGIVNDIAIGINAETVRAQHGLTADSEVALGFHAIAYLLWGETGQRSSDAFRAPNLSPQQRQSGLTTADLPANRRLALLRLQVTLLQDDLKNLVILLQQPTSPVNADYRSLSPGEQIELWRSALIRLLQGFGADPSLTAADDRHWLQHNRFAGQVEQAVAAQLRAADSLLFRHGEEHRPLIDWLAPQHAQTLQKQLTRAQALLEKTGDNGQSLAEKDIEELQKLLQHITELLG